MKAKIILMHILFSIIINIFSINTFACENNKIIKVGIYEYAPYIMIDSKGKISGYYNDYLNLIKDKFNFEFEYSVLDIETGLKKLEEGKIDVMMGVAITPENKDKFIFSQHSIAKEEFSIYSNKNVNIEDLESSNITKVGILENEANEKWIEEFFETRNINTENFIINDYKKLQTALKNNDVDIIIDSSHNDKDKNKVYTFNSYPLYIAGNEKSIDTINFLDECHSQISYRYYDISEKIYKKYFSNKLDTKNIIILCGIIFINLLIATLYIYPKVKKKIIKNKIKNRIKNNRYFLQYQPIHNPRNNNVMGFEALLRLLDKDNKVIPPYKFIPEIEENDMLFDVSIWILEKVIKDYSKIKEYNCVNKNDFYISCNISLNEIENDNFVEKAIEILNKYNMVSNKICLEVIERIKVSNSKKLLKNIALLKNAGFKIAIDDFGVEYSNLDIVDKIDADIIKIDKYFVNGIGKDSLKNEAIMYICRIAKIKNKYIVLEGVEEKYQHELIKHMVYDFIFVQGYFYNKPMNIEHIKHI